MSTATITRQSDGSAILHTPYDAEFVERLKATIPVSLRRWSKTDKTWIVSGSGIAQAVLLAHAFYDQVVDIPATPPEPTRFRPQTPHRTLFLTDDAPPEIVPVVYKALAKLCHPDKGGDVRQMQRINEAYEQIQKMVQR